jgi:hypothetical protein
MQATLNRCNSLEVIALLVALVELKRASISGLDLVRKFTFLLHVSGFAE